MALTVDLPNFKLTEFRHPELVDWGCAHWLQEVRDRYGKPLELTSDARTAAENDAQQGSSPTSLHLLGRAFDLRWLDDDADRYAFVAAVVHVSEVHGYPAELEFVLTGDQRHIHVGWYADPRHAAKLELRVS